jgi:hypothetical protein
MSDIARLTVALHANSAQFVSELRRSQQQAGRWRADISKAFKVAATASAAAATGLTVALSVVYKEQSALIDQTAKFADRIGVSTEALSQLRYAAELSGLGAKDLDMAMQRMTRRIAEAAAGSGEAAPALKQLGIDAQKLGQMTPDQQLHVLADAFKGVESQSERVRLAFKLFDSGGVAMINMLGNGSKSLKAMTDEADELGLTLTRVNAAKVEMANDAMTRVAATTKAFKQELTTQLAPVVASIGELFTENAKKHGGMSVFISEGLDTIYGAVGRVGDVYRGWVLIFAGIEAAWSKLKLSMLKGTVELSKGSFENSRSLVKVATAPFRTVIDQAAKHVDFFKSFKADLDSQLEKKQPTFIDVDKAKAEFEATQTEYLKLISTPLPSESIDTWIKTNRVKLQKLAEDYAAGVNKNDPDSPGEKIQTPAEKAAEKAAARKAEMEARAEERRRERLDQEKERSLEASRNEIDNIRQSFLDKSSLETEQWEERQEQLNAWRELELEAIKGNKAKILEVEMAHTDLTEKNYTNHRKNLEKLEDSKNQVRLQSAQKVFEGLGGMAKAFSGEQSNVYRVMFAAQKAYTLASVLLTSKDVISKAWNSAIFPFNLPAVGMAIAETGALKAAVSAIATPSYHTGGIAGEKADSPLKSNEIYAKLLKKEEILTENDPRHRNNLSFSSNTSTAPRAPNVIIHNNIAPGTATAEQDEAGQLHVFLEKADEYIGEAINGGWSKTGQAIENSLGASRVGYR